MKVDENTRVTVALHFKIRNSEMLGGKGTEGFSRISVDFPLKSMAGDGLKSYMERQIEAVADMCHVSVDDVDIISQEEYDYERGEGEAPCYGSGCINNIDCPEYGKWCNKLADYENMEEQGLLLKLPCAIGDTVYEVYNLCGDGTWEIDEHKILLEDLEKIGKTIFVTREEAEAALEKVKGKNG